MQDVTTKAAEIGAEHGRNAAGWYFDGNTNTDAYRGILDGIESGDPIVLDSFPTSPLSGEWADEYSLSDLAYDTGVTQGDDAFDDVCTAYENAFYSASAVEIERMCRYQLS